MNLSHQMLPLAAFVILSACSGGGATPARAQQQTAAPAVTPAAATPAASEERPSIGIERLPTVGSAGPTGVYDLHYVFDGIYAFLDNGEFYGLHMIGGTAVGHPRGKLSATNSVATPDPVYWANFIDDAAKVGDQEIHPTFGRDLSAGTLTANLISPMGNFTATASGQRGYGDGSGKTLYDNPLGLDVLAGSYTGYLRTVGQNHTLENLTSLTIDASGKLTATGSGSGCTFSGRLTQYKNSGVYKLNAAVSGQVCLLSNLKGIVLPLSYVDKRPQIAVELDSDDQRQSAVMVAVKQ
jgi:hypothetical protein